VDNNHVVVKPLTPDDAEAFKALRLKAILDSPASIWSTYEEEAQLTLEDIRNRIRHTDTQVVFGAFSDSVLTGIVGWRRELLTQVAHKAGIWGVFVDPEWRGSGIAHTLLEAAISHAREQKVLQIHLSVHTENVRAQRLYRSAGFTSYGQEPRAIRIGGRFYDEERMMLRFDG
jgi:ribosomal protein S18 acetylase RimI-like enzyme